MDRSLWEELPALSEFDALFARSLLGSRFRATSWEAAREGGAIHVECGLSRPAIGRSPPIVPDDLCIQSARVVTADEWFFSSARALADREPPWGLVPIELEARREDEVPAAGAASGDPIEPAEAAKALGEFLRSVRSERGLADVADRAGMQASNLCEIEAGRNPRGPTIATISRILHANGACLAWRVDAFSRIVALRTQPAPADAVVLADRLFALLPLEDPSEREALSRSAGERDAVDIAGRLLRELRGMSSVRAVSNRGGFTAPWLSNVERGRGQNGPTISSFARVLEALDYRLTFDRCSART